MAGGEGSRNVFLFVPNIIGYVRVLLAAAAFVLMPREPGPAAACYLLSALLDAVDGLAARMLGQGSRLGAMLDMLTDRCSLLCLLLNLALLYPPAAPCLQLSIVLDLASHWLHMHTSTLEGAESHKGAGPGGNRLLQLYYGNRAVLFLLCAANEGFYCSLYLVYFWEGPAVVPGGPGLFRVLLWLCAPPALLKGGLNLLQLGGRAAPGGHGRGGAPAATETPPNPPTPPGVN